MKNTLTKRQKNLAAGLTTRGKPRKKIGRKWFDGSDENETLSKLRLVWGMGGTMGEAAYYANVSIGAIYRYMEAHAEIREERRRLRNKPILMARESVVKGIKDDPDLALKYLKCKRSNEFSEKIKNEHSGNIGVDISEKKYARIIQREAQRIKNSGKKQVD